MLGTGADQWVLWGTHAYDGILPLLLMTAIFLIHLFTCAYIVNDSYCLLDICCMPDYVFSILQAFLYSVFSGNLGGRCCSSYFQIKNLRKLREVKFRVTVSKKQSEQLSWAMCGSKWQSLHSGSLVSPFGGTRLLLPVEESWWVASVLVRKANT
jgi:hypothetical protein